MPTYDVCFRSDNASASHEFTAKTPQDALAEARGFDPQQLWIEPYDLNITANEIVVHDENGDHLAVWYDNDMRLRLAASDLLELAEEYVKFLKSQPPSVGKMYLVRKALSIITRATSRGVP